MVAHATLSPSARHRWQLCPASVREALKYPESKAGPAAVDGTHSHTLLEHCLTHGANAMTMVGETLSDHEGLFVVDESRALRVNAAVQYIRKRRDELGAELLVEQTVDPSTAVGREDMSGTADALLISEHTLEIIDYKDGFNQVSAFDNPQLMQYAVGAIAMLSSKRYEKLANLRMTIIQPKMADIGQEFISHVDVDLKEFYPREVAKLLREGASVDEPDSPHVPGEKQCKYCPHASNCGPRTTHVLDKAGIKFGPVSVLEQTAEKDVKDLTDEQLREIIEALPLLRGYLDSVEETALERMTHGVHIEGLKVVRGRGSRSWALPEGEIEAKLRKMQVPKSEIWVTKLISPAQAEKLKWTTARGVQKTLSPRQKEVLQKVLIQKSEGALTVVSAADERPGVDFGNLKEMFGAVPPQEDVPEWLR